MIWQACGRRGSGNPQKGFDVAVFVRMGLQVGLQGVPGGAWRAKRSLWCPAVKEKAGKKREKLFWAGHREQKEACGAPPAEKKQGRREKSCSGRGMGSKRKPVVPRRQRKNREEERKSEAGGAQEKKKSFGAPPSKKKQGRREKIRAGRGTGSKKKLSYPACHQ